MALTELECLERRNKITRDLDADGCHFGELLSATVMEMRKKLVSKFAGFETVAQLMLDLGRKNKSEMEVIKKMAVDAIACTHAAQKTVIDMDVRAEKVRNKFDRLQAKFSWRLLWMVLAGVLGGNGLFLVAYIAIMSLSKQ
jgi:hypothetical protein